MNTKNKKYGFTIVEMLMSLMILAMLMSALAVAFDASIANYKANESISKVNNTARQVLLRITTELRTAQAVALIGTDTNDDADNTSCSILTADGRDITYNYDATTDMLYLVTNDDTTDADYVIARNVTAATFNRSTVPGDASAIRNVRINLTLTDENGDYSYSQAAAAVIRKNL